MSDQNALVLLRSRDMIRMTFYPRSFPFSSPRREFPRPKVEEKEEGAYGLAFTACKDAAIDFNPDEQRDQIDRTKSTLAR